MFLPLLRGRSASRLQFRRRRERVPGQFPSHMLEQERRGRRSAFLKTKITPTAVHIPNATPLMRLTSRALRGEVQPSHRE